MVDVNSYQHAVLNLTSINLPGGVQRRRSEEDQLNMRKFFKEGDIISAEVMQVSSGDGRIMLQTRNLKYGKLLNGFMVNVDSNFVRRMKNHILDFLGDRFEFKIGIIIGTNGYIWIHSPTANQLDKKAEVTVPVLKPVSFQERECMAVLRNVILCLEREQLPIFKDTIELALKQFYDKREAYDLKPKQLLSRDEIRTKPSGDDQSMQEDNDQETMSVSTIICHQAKMLIENEI
jgi:exosome complex component RRP4